MENTPRIKKPMTKEDVMLLVNLIANYPTITSKETNAASNRLKEEAWGKLTNSFNSKCSSTPRTKEQLKLKWDNLKKAAKKRARISKMNTIKTGGDKTDYIHPDSILDKVISMISSTGTVCAVPFGGDGEEEIAIADTRYTVKAENTDDTLEVCLSVEEAPLPDMSENDSSSEQETAKKRKINYSTPERMAESTRRKFVYGMPTKAKLLPNRGRIRYNDGRLEKNLAIANYYNKMTEKLELEILLLKKGLENKDSDK